MAKKKRAPIFDIWMENVRSMETTWARVAKDLNIDYKWMIDFVNDGTMAEQVYRVKKLDRYFKTEGRFDDEKYRSEKVEQIEEERLFK